MKCIRERVDFLLIVVAISEILKYAMHNFMQQDAVHHLFCIRSNANNKSIIQDFAGAACYSEIESIGYFDLVCFATDFY